MKNEQITYFWVREVSSTETKFCTTASTTPKDLHCAPDNFTKNHYRFQTDYVLGKDRSPKQGERNRSEARVIFLVTQDQNK